MNKEYLISIALENNLRSVEELEKMNISELKRLLDDNLTNVTNRFDTTTRIVNQSVDMENRTVELEWSYGTKGKRTTWSGSYYEELVVSEESIDLKRLKSGAPLLRVHDQFDLDSVIGVIEDAWIEGEKAVAKVRFAKDEISERIFQKVVDGILKNVSVGYAINEWEEIHNEDDKIPTIRVTKWEPGELSIVPIGFDYLAQIRSKNFKLKKENKFNQKQMEKKRMKDYLIKLALKMKLGSDEEIRTMELDQLQTLVDNAVEAKRVATTEPTLQPQQTNTPSSDDSQKRIDEAVKAEKTRCLEIRKSVKDAGLTEDIADEYIAKGHDLEQVRFNVNLFKKHQTDNTQNKINSTPSVEVSDDNSEARREGIIEAVLHGQDPANFQISDKGKQFAGQQLLRMMEQHLERKSHESNMDFIERTMTSSDLPLILANVASKTAQKRYDLAPKTYEAWTNKGTLKDYKESTQVRAGEIGSLQPMNEKGEYNQSNIGEEAEKAQLTKYGVMHSFSDIMLINDDLDQIMRVSGEAGVAQARLDNKLSYQALTSNPAMLDTFNVFSADHANLGSAGDSSETTFDEAFQLMRKQKGIDNRDFLNLAPAFLVCGPDQETAAKKFLAVIQPEQSANVNPFSNSVQLIVDAELTGNQYYFIANPMLIDTVKVNRLQGQENVRVASRTNWKNDAIELKLTYAVQAKALDFRGMVKNAGQ